MSLTEKQIEMLGEPLLRQHIAERSQSGITLNYIEAWHAISECNRIFGFDRWDRETMYLNETCEAQREIGQRKDPGWEVGYLAKVRVTVRDEEGAVIAVREGTGAGTGIARSRTEAHESAAKEAESDAMKRALMTFGNQFGLALYDKQKRGVTEECNGNNSLPKASARALYTELQQDVQAADSTDALTAWYARRKDDIGALPKDWLNNLRSSYAARLHDLKTGALNDVEQ